MPAPTPLDGYAFKLVDSAGNVLGVITVSRRMLTAWRGDGDYCALDIPPPVSAVLDFRQMPATTPHAALANARDLAAGDESAIMLVGLTLAEFEKLPGCAFAPGAAYLQRLLG